MADAEFNKTLRDANKISGQVDTSGSSSTGHEAASILWLIVHCQRRWRKSHPEMSARPRAAAKPTLFKSTKHMDAKKLTEADRKGSMVNKGLLLEKSVQVAPEPPPMRTLLTKDEIDETLYNARMIELEKKSG